MEMEYVSKTNYGEAYYNHEVFELIKHMMDYYDKVAYSSFGFIPNGTFGAANYSSYVFMPICLSISIVISPLRPSAFGTSSKTLL